MKSGMQYWQRDHSLYLLAMFGQCYVCFLKWRLVNNLKKNRRRMRKWLFSTSLFHFFLKKFRQSVTKIFATKITTEDLKLLLLHLKKLMQHWFNIENETLKPDSTLIQHSEWDFENWGKLDATLIGRGEGKVRGNKANQRLN